MVTSNVWPVQELVTAASVALILHEGDKKSLAELKKMYETSKVDLESLL